MKMTSLFSYRYRRPIEIVWRLEAASCESSLMAAAKKRRLAAGEAGGFKWRISSDNLNVAA